MRKRAADVRPGDLCALATFPPTLALALQVSLASVTSVEMLFLERGALVPHRMAPGRPVAVVDALEPARDA